MARLFCPALLAVSLFFAPSVRAASRGAEPRDPVLGKKTSQAPDASLAGSIEAKDKGKSGQVVGPALGFETFRYAMEVQVSGKRQEETADLDKLIHLGGSSSEMPGWLFRLAELHWEEAQYLFFEANRKDDAIAAARGEPERVDALRAEKKDLEGRSRAEQAAAIARYREIARRFPNYARLDEVVFFLGENLWKQNRRLEALEAYKVLITRFPRSRYVPDAWMAFGEHYFDSAEKKNRRENLNKALETYKRAATFTESGVYGYALYKQAWVHYNLGNWNEALDLFRAVIFFGDLPTTTVAPDKKLALAREARKDYVRTYSHVGSPRGAFEEFARVGGKDAPDMLKSLAGLYFDEGKDREAILVYHGLIVADRTSPEAPFFQARIVTCAGRMGKKQLAVQQAGIFLGMLRDAEKRGGDEKSRKSLAEARQVAENALRTLAVQYHAEYKKTREDAVAVLAAELYRQHLEAFPDSRNVYEMRFFHAELLYSLEKFAEAGAEYARVAQMDIDRMKQAGPDGSPQRPGKFFLDALESAVQSFDVVAKRADTGEKRPQSETGRLPIPPEKQKLLEACARYLEFAKQGSKRVEVSYKAAQIYYRYNAFPEAVKLFADIAENHPKHELARYAANLTLDCFNIQSDWRNVNAWAKRYLDDAELMRAQPGLREDLGKVIEQSAFKLVEELEKAQRPGEAAEAYVAFARDWPGSKLAPTALFNASVDLVRAGRLERAMSVREQLTRRYPRDPLIPKIAFTNAQDREAVADFELAAEAYEQYFHGWKAAAGAKGTPRRSKRGARPVAAAPAGDAGGYEEAKARDALYNAGVLREGLGQPQRAEADRLLFAETWPSSPEARKVFLSVADLREKEGSLSRELRLLEEYQERFAKDPTDWLVIQGRIAKLHARLGSAGGERRAYEEAIRYWHAHQGRVGERALEVVAQAQYLAIEPAFANYERIDFAVPARLSPPRQVRWLKAQLEWKGRKLLDLQKRYTEVVNTKQADPAVCALYKIGLAYERFAHALQSAPLPPEIRHNRALAEEYRAQLRQLAEAPEKKSIEALEYAMTKSRELAVSNACSRAATEVLVRFKPEQYGPPLEKLPEPAPDAVASLPRGHQLTSTRFRPAPHELASSAGEDVRAPLGVAGRSGSTEDSLARDPDVGTEGPAPRRDGSAGSREEDLLP